MSYVGAVLGFEHSACLCRDVPSGSVMDVPLIDVHMRDVSKNTCCLRKIYYCSYSKIIFQ